MTKTSTPTPPAPAPSPTPTPPLPKSLPTTGSTPRTQDARLDALLAGLAAAGLAAATLGLLPLLHTRRR